MNFFIISISVFQFPIFFCLRILTDGYQIVFFLSLLILQRCNSKKSKVARYQSMKVATKPAKNPDKKEQTHSYIFTKLLTYSLCGDSYHRKVLQSEIDSSGRPRGQTSRKLEVKFIPETAFAGCPMPCLHS